MHHVGAIKAHPALGVCHGKGVDNFHRLAMSRTAQYAHRLVKEVHRARVGEHSVSAECLEIAARVDHGFVVSRFVRVCRGPYPLDAGCDRGKSLFLSPQYHHSDHSITKVPPQYYHSATT